MNIDFLFTIESWNTEQERSLAVTNIFELVQRDMVLGSEQHRASFTVLKAPDWVNVLALTKDQKVILVEQYRYGIQAPTLELPGGVCDPEELPLETSKRELLEETGYISEEWVSLGKVSSNPAMQDNYTHSFLALNCEKVADQKLDGNERIHVHLISVAQFLDNVESGIIHHSLVAATTAKYLLYLRD
ncbi:MAG: NUDIX domain-containing protein [Balneola sp.]|nr:NUDIX domain-containing protein [Balneola sp.]